MRNRQKGSVGQLISTLCFLGVGLFLIGEVALAPQDLPRSLVLLLCAVLSLAGALRFQIAWLARYFRPV